MDAGTRQLVHTRARERCEYCRIPQDAVEATFHVEHCIAKQHRGDDDPGNLALACDRCNLYKGPNLTAIDPTSGEIATLFHPRRERWEDHFSLQGAIIVGLTSSGRATIQLLRMNAPRRLHLRRVLLQFGATFND